jgi:hypothetical protein
MVMKPHTKTLHTRANKAFKPVRRLAYLRRPTEMTTMMPQLGQCQVRGQGHAGHDKHNNDATYYNASQAAL